MKRLSEYITESNADPKLVNRIRDLVKLSKKNRNDYKVFMMAAALTFERFPSNLDDQYWSDKGDDQLWAALVSLYNEEGGYQQYDRWMAAMNLLAKK